MDKRVQNVVVVGGGTSGWITAALLSKILGHTLNLTLIESDKIGIIGVGEATIPPIIHLNNALGISEKTFLNETNGTIKLGIEFDNWGQHGDSYMHAFGGIGKNLPFCDFHHTWLRSQQLGDSADFWRYSLNYQAAKQNKFAKPPAGQGGLEYAYHFDAGLYAKLLSRLSQQQGVTRIEGVVADVQVDGDSGNILSVQLDSGERIDGDLFIDCTGLKALLIEQTLNTGFIDYSHWLPCDRAVAVPSEGVLPIIPYTRSTAHQAGWQWRIPLQHRTGNGLVYCSQYMSDDQAIETLLSNLDGPALAEPKVIKFKTGVRRKQWHKNVVAIGLSSGFFEPLESTNIHLIQTAAIRLIKLFPHQGMDESMVAEFNRQSRVESDRMRDFIILHYTLNQKTDSPFWQRCRNMDIPDTLKAKMDLFADTGRVFREQDELFTEIAWQQVMIGQNLRPNDYHPVAGGLSTEQVLEFMKNLRTLTDRQVTQWPTHDEFLASL